METKEFEEIKTALQSHGILLPEEDMGPDELNWWSKGYMAGIKDCLGIIQKYAEDNKENIEEGATEE